MVSARQSERAIDRIWTDRKTAQTCMHEETRGQMRLDLVHAGHIGHEVVRDVRLRLVLVVVQRLLAKQ